MIQENVDLAPFTTFRIGGKARWFIEPGSLEELSDAVRFAKREGVSIHILGGGSNILVSDSGVNGLVIRIKKTGDFGQINQLDDSALRWRVGAGVPLQGFLSTILGKGIAGPEELAGIPGTVGGALFMNAGNPSVGLGDWVDNVLVVDSHGEVQEIVRQDLGFSYRQSRVGENIVVWSEFRFSTRGDQVALMEKARLRRELKAQSQPIAERSAGCVFKNPDSRSAGMLIDQAGCKGWHVGGAVVSEKHANFVLNRDKATARDVITLIGKVRNAVRGKFGVELELEIKTWGLSSEEIACLGGRNND